MKTLGVACVAACLLAALASTGRAEPWPQWRGPDRTDVSKETGLLKQWPDAGPKQLWLYKDAGVGYAGFSVVGETLYTMGARDGTEYLIALNVKDGTQKWATEIGKMLKNGYGDGPRGTPTVDGQGDAARLYTMSGQGNLVCAKVDGSVVWKAAMQDFGGKIPQWGYTESPLVDGDKILCTPGGGKGAVVALNKQDGKLIWQSEKFKEGAHYSSIVPAEINGQKQYVQRTMTIVAGLDPATGDLLWQTDFPGRTAVIPTPIVHDNMVFVTAGYGSGCKCVKVEPGNKVSVAYENKSLSDHHGGVVLVGDHLYGHSNEGGWTCMKFKTGDVVWQESKKLEKGGLTCAGGLLYLLGEKTGQVVLIEPSPEGWKEHGRFKLQPLTTQRSRQGGIWTHPVVSDGRLYLRDQELLFCFDVKAN